MRIGYVRSDRGNARALDDIAALEGVGCARIVLDSKSGGKAASGMLTDLVARMGRGDVLVVTDLRHIAGDIGPLLRLLLDLRARGISVERSDSRFDTSNETVATTLELLAEHGAGRPAGHPADAEIRPHAGRPRRMRHDDIERARTLLLGRVRSVAEIAREFGVSRATLYRSLRELGPG